MKKYLLPHEGTYYKANLHCHSNVSDARFTPVELKEVYMSMGYSIIAFTDHDILIPHPELTDENFLALNGYEIEVEEEGFEDRTQQKDCHLCLIALEPDNLKQVCWHREKYLFCNAVNYKNQVQFDESEPDYVRHYTPECINDIIRRAREGGFFVTYNHPEWSGEGYEQYMKYDGMNAMEIFNTSSVYGGYEDYCPHVYDAMLRGGKRIYCIAADDNHNSIRRGTRDSGGGWIMIKADRLEYRTITKALEEGNFYASTGPEIHDLWIENGELHVTTSDAEQIRFNYGTRRVKRFWAENGESINHASMELDPHGIYVRVTVEDHRGRCANSNAYFLDTLMSM